MSKTNTFSIINLYLGNRKGYLTAAIWISALSHAISMLPFYFIWRLILLMINHDPNIGTKVPQLAWLIFATMIAGLLMYLLALIFSHLAAFRMERNMRYMSMKEIMYKPLGFFVNENSGKIRKIVDDNPLMIHSLIAHQLIDMAGTGIVLIATFILIFIFDWRMGVACLIPLGIGVWSMSSMMSSKHYQSTMSEYLNYLQKMNSEAIEYTRGIPVVKAFQQSIYSFKRFHKSILLYKDWVLKYCDECENKMIIYFISLNSFLFVLVPMAAILIATGSDWKKISLSLILYALITPFFSSCTMRLMSLSARKSQAEEAIKRMTGLIDESEKLKTTSTEKKIKRYDIDVENVSFSYEENRSNTLKNISLRIPESQNYALIGMSGSGKTTLLRLIAHFWDVSEGSIKIGGVDIREVDPNDLMKNISFVFQTIRLFKKSIRDNILYGSPNATEEDLQRCIDMAQCRSIVDKLPQGLDTIIGKEGISLSGGEQQRIVLARAFLKNAPILLLDEPTDFSDPENENAIKEVLNDLMKEKTILMIAHRLNSVKDADKIFVMDGGEIKESGSHSELMKKNGIYTRMWNDYQSSINWTLN